MWCKSLAWAGTVAAGVLLGLATAWAAMHAGFSHFGSQYGVWSFNRAAGSTAADPYTRAVIARYGFLALSSREALYFTAAQDAQGRPLQESCVYELSGGRFDARWWSATLYAADSFLARNDDGAASVDATSIAADTDERWRARIAPTRADAANWLSSRDAGAGFSVTLRVYNPGDSFAPSAQALPALETISCAAGQP